MALLSLPAFRFYSSKVLNKYTVRHNKTIQDWYYLNFIQLNKVLCSNQKCNKDGYYSYIQPNSLSDKISAEFKRRLWLGGTIETFEHSFALVDSENANSLTIEEELRSVKQLKKDCIVTYTRTIYNSNDKAIILKETRQLFYTDERFTKRLGNIPDFEGFKHTNCSKAFYFTDDQILKFSKITSNPHYIHLNAHYNKIIEGYPEKLVVQGPNLLTQCIKYLQTETGLLCFSKIKYRIKTNLFADEIVFIKLNKELKEMKLGNDQLGTVLQLSYM